MGRGRALFLSIYGARADRSLETHLRLGFSFSRIPSVKWSKAEVREPLHYNCSGHHAPQHQNAKTAQSG